MIGVVSMKKYILLLILIFLTVGCKAEYTIKINNDRSVEESIVGLENEEYYSRYPRSSKKRVIRFTTALVNDYLEKNNFTREIITNGDYTGERVKSKYKNLKDYFSKSKAYEQLYETFDSDINGNIVTISLKNRYPKNGNSVDRFIINDCKVKIVLPFSVKEHNADYYNESENSYTWNLNIDDSKEIYIQFDTGKNIKTNFNKYIVYSILGIVLLIVLIIFIKFYTHRKSQNKI